MKQRFFFSVCFLLLFTILGWTQEKTVSGTVVSETDGTPLLGASVFVKGSTARGTQTDFDGNYTISVKEGEVLVFSYVGFTLTERKISGGG